MRTNGQALRQNGNYALWRAWENFRERVKLSLTSELVANVALVTVTLGMVAFLAVSLHRGLQNYAMFGF